MQIEHQSERQRFVAHTDAGEAELAYQRRGERVLDLQHTFVPPEARGRGVGEALVRHAFDLARDQGYRLVPSCPFVAAWLERHPDRRDVADGG